jgi:hypothetical protein
MTDTFMFHLLGGLTWALDGASTRAYQTGIIGNNTTPPPPPPPKPEDNTTNSAANGSGLHKSAASPSMAAAGVVGGALALGLTLLF